MREQTYRARGSSLGKHPASRGNRAHAAAGDAPACENRGGTSSGSGVTRAAAGSSETSRAAAPASCHRPKALNQASPKPAPPQISPQLSAQDLAATKTITTKNMLTAEQNMQLASGKQLNAAQKDLADKINGFLGEAHEAITADDWVRAQNLAEKARVLSVELVKSF